MRALAIGLLTVFSLAGAARAQTADSSVDVKAVLAAPFARTPLRLSVGDDRTYPAAGSPTSAPRTSVDHQFTQEGLTASAGFLCGLDDFAAAADGVAAGPSSSFGRGGEFVGARLGYAFH